MDSNCQSHLEVLLPFEPLLGQLTKPVKQLGPILAPAPLVDQDEEGGVGGHLGPGVSITGETLGNAALSHLQFSQTSRRPPVIAPS